MTGHHDDFFKETFSIKENVADFTFHVLPPEVRELLDLSSLHLENQSFLDDELSSHFSDLIYKCNLRGSKIKIALLFEHKSYVDPDLPFQLNKYMVNIWNYNKKQKEAFIPVIPIVLYHGKKNWNPGSFSDCFTDIPTEIKRFIPNFDYIFIDLSKYTDKEIKNEIFKNALLKIRLLILKNIFDEEKLQNNLAAFFNIGLNYFSEMNGLKFLESTVKYIYKMTEIKTDIITEVLASLSKEAGRIAMSTAEVLRKEGFNQGISQGISQCAINTIKKMLLKGMMPKDIAELLDIDNDVIQKISKGRENEVTVIIE